MKKFLLSCVVGAIGIAFGYSQASVTFAPITLPTAGAAGVYNRTNIYNGALKLTSLTFDTSAMTGATNFNFLVFDAARSMPLCGAVNGTNEIHYTNSGYAYFVQYSSNMNFGAAGSVSRLGVNSNVNSMGAVSVITLSPNLSNYTFTASNWTDAAFTRCPQRATLSVISNIIGSVTTYTWPDGVYFARGITLSNTTGSAAFTGAGITVTVKGIPYM